MKSEKISSQRFIKGEFVLVPSIKHLLGLPASAQVVYMWLAYHSDYSTGECYPSYSTLETETGLAKSTLIRAIKTLVKKGLIKRIKRKKKNSKENTSNRYILLNLGSSIMTPPGSIMTPPGSIMTLELESLNNNHLTSVEKKENTHSKNLFGKEYLNNLINGIDTEELENAFGITKQSVICVAENIRDYQEETGKQSKNYKATMRKWIKGDIQNKKITQYTQTEKTLARGANSGETYDEFIARQSYDPTAEPNYKPEPFRE